MERFYKQKKRIFPTGAFIPNGLLLGTNEYISPAVDGVCSLPFRPAKNHTATKSRGWFLTI